MKAADAETVGGKPISAFLLAGSKTGVGDDGLTYVNAAALTAALRSASPSGGAATSTTAAGTAGYLGVFTDSSNLGDSVLFQAKSGRVGINTSAPAAPFHMVAQETPGAFFDVFSGSPSTVLGALPAVHRAARGTAAEPSPVQLDDILGGLAVRGYNGVAFTGGRGQVMFKAADTWSETSNGTYLVMSTTPVKGVTSTERMRITPDGYVGIGTSAPTSPVDVRLASSHTYLSVGADTVGGLFLVADHPHVGFNLLYPASTNTWTRNAAGFGGYFGFDPTIGLFRVATVPAGAAGSTTVPDIRMS